MKKDAAEKCTLQVKKAANKKSCKFKKRRADGEPNAARKKSSNRENTCRNKTLHCSRPPGGALSFHPETDDMER